jgi:hypothetical protein
MMGECERDALWREENEADNLKDYLEEIIEVVYGRTDIDVGRDELVRYILELKHNEKMVELMSSDNYLELYNKYEEVYGGK